MFDEFKETHYAPPPLLLRMVEAGRLGKKAGQGFYATDRGRSTDGAPERHGTCIGRGLFG